MKPACLVLVPVSLAYLVLSTGVIGSANSWPARRTSSVTGVFGEASMILTASSQFLIGLPLIAVILSPACSTPLAGALR